MGHAAPITRLTLSFAIGVAAGLSGAPAWLAPLPLLLGALGPIGPSSRPVTLALTASLTAGWLSAAVVGPGAACGVAEPGTSVHLPGHLLASPRFGSAPLERYDGCGVVTVVVRDADRDLPPGTALVFDGTWRSGAYRPWLQLRGTERYTGRGHRGAAIGRMLVRRRDALAGRLHRLYGERAPLVTALVLARREGMESGVREAFAATGIAHLLAISGFHVGLVAGLVAILLRTSGVPRRRAPAGAALVSWAYVALIGFPDAACRAALILTLVALATLRGRPASRWGALATAALLLLVLDPTRLASAGFQLSFAGAGGLVAWSGGVEASMRRRVPPRTPRGPVRAVAAGVAATLATLPIAAWHFERVSLVGIPVTLVATPLVALALPGAILSLLVDFVSTPASAFLAGGVTLLLDALTGLTGWLAAWPGVAAWTTRGSVVGGFFGVLVATRIAWAPRVGRRTRRALTSVYVVAGVVGWPLVVGLQSRGTLELVMIDVGQGDAIAIRTPRGRWLLVDTGPPDRPGRGEGGTPDLRAHPVVRALRARGVDRLEALVLTHPDLDHIGGALAVLSSVRVGRVLDPGLPAPKQSYVDILEAARARDVGWEAARRGRTLRIDGVELRILHPTDETEGGEASNASSVVLLLVWRDFEALLTGDAYVDVERAIAPDVGDIDVLKVGHHGSRTSTDSSFLASARPEIALIPVGRSNRYGHPAEPVLERLHGVGARVYRSDLHGTVRVLVGRDGRVDVRPARGGRTGG